MMKGSSRRSAEVYDWKEEDTQSGLASAERSQKFKSPSAKYKYLECFARPDIQKTEIDSVPCANLGAIVSDHGHCNANSHIILGKEDEGNPTREGKFEFDAVPLSYSSSREHFHPKTDNHEPRSFLSELETRASSPGEATPGNNQLNCAFVETSSRNEVADAVLDTDETRASSPGEVTPGNNNLNCALVNETADAMSDADETRASSPGDATPGNNQLNCALVNETADAMSDSDETRASSPGDATPGNNQLNCALAESPSSNESADAMSDGDESVEESSSSTLASDCAEHNGYLDGRASDHCFGGLEMDEVNMAVVVRPDLFVCGDRHCSDALITFSINCIEVKGYGDQGTFSFQWGIDDIINIDGQYLELVGMATVKIRVKSKDAIGADGVRGNSGNEDLAFEVFDRNWSETLEKIMSLDGRYVDVWHAVIDSDMGMDGDTSFGQNNSYFPNFDQPFEDVVYPKEDSDPVSISKRDVDLLQPETFINDTIIDFYIKYLKNRIQPEEKHRFHFFNSFFFRKLAVLEKDPFDASEGRAAFLRVRKWTRKVNLFEKDYIFIPVNFNLHWSLIVICHPGEVAKFKDEDRHTAIKVPCILHMDSIKGTHAGLKNHVQSYLWEEWKEKQNEISEDISARFLNMRFVPLELPQQENSFDCGLFLLHYVERFLEEAPANFSPFKINKFSNFLNSGWFQPAEPSVKRTVIQNLIHQLVRNCSRENSPAAQADENNKNAADVELLSERYSPVQASQVNLLRCQADKGIEMTLLPTSCMRNSQFVNDQSLVLREFFDSGSSLLDVQYQHFDQPKGVMSPIEEEDTETGEQFVYSPSGSNLIKNQACVSSYLSRDLEARSSWLPGLSTQTENVEEHRDLDADASSYSSDDSLNLGVIENCTDNSKEKSTSLKNADPLTESLTSQRSPSTENTEPLTETLAGDIPKTIKDLENPDTEKNEPLTENLDSKENEEDDPVSSCQENKNPVELNQESGLEEEKKVSCSVVRKIGDDLSLGLEEQQGVKRPRLSGFEERRRCTRSMAKDRPLVS